MSMGSTHAKVRRVLQGDRSERDGGMTLVELLVAMGILTIILAVFTVGLISMVKTTARNKVKADSLDQFRVVFSRMDREVRYASDINRPVLTNGKYYLEYLVANVESGDAEQCVQWRYVVDTHVLQRRTWDPADTSRVSSWTTTVTGLRNDLADASQIPFVMYQAGTASAGRAYTNQRLRVFLSSGDGTSTNGAGSTLSTTFVARNSSDQSVTNADGDGNGVSDTQVCQKDVGRP